MELGVVEHNELSEIVRNQGEENVLIQLAEECAELSQAALKMVRVKRKTSPVSVGASHDNLIEECADVLVSIEAVRHLLVVKYGVEFDRRVKDTMCKKIGRWWNRTFKKNGMKGVTPDE